jgi:hypothetical protein
VIIYLKRALDLALVQEDSFCHFCLARLGTGLILKRGCDLAYFDSFV